LEDGIEAEVKAGRIKKSRSWDKIAAWMGADATALRSTVDRYNTFCRNGYDADFLKNKDYLLPLQNPPYYAILAHQGIDTIIGITINHHMEVLDRQFRPIGGLYASGVATSGWLGEGYGFSGSELGFYIFSGYTLGRNSLQQTDW
jgi:fumarate reductase flavoprotein subunit